MNIMISKYKIIATMLIVYIKNIKGCQSRVNNSMEAILIHLLALIDYQKLKILMITNQKKIQISCRRRKKTLFIHCNSNISKNINLNNRIYNHQLKINKKIRIIIIIIFKKIHLFKINFKLIRILITMLLLMVIQMNSICYFKSRMYLINSLILNKKMIITKNLL